MSLRRLVKISEATKEKIRSGLLSALLGGLGFVALAIFEETSKPFADHVVSAISSTTLLWLSLLLLLASLFLGSWLLVLVFGDKSERLRRQHRHSEARGFWIHRESGQRVCGNCLIDGICSPLALNYHSEKAWWQCGRKECGMSYEKTGDAA